MSLPAPQPFLMPRPTLPGRPSKTKHEYHDGEVFAMAGASDAHVTVAGNVYMALRNHLRGSPCSVFISDMKLRVEEDNAFFTPMSSSPAPRATVGRATARVPPCWWWKCCPRHQRLRPGRQVCCLPQAAHTARIRPDRPRAPEPRFVSPRRRQQALGAAPHRGWRPRRMGQRGPSGAAGGPVRRRAYYDGATTTPGARPGISGSPDAPFFFCQRAWSLGYATR